MEKQEKVVPGQEEPEEEKEQKEETVETLVGRLKKKLELEKVACLLGLISLENAWNKDGNAGHMYTDGIRPEFVSACTFRIGQTQKRLEEETKNNFITKAKA